MTRRVVVGILAVAVAAATAAWWWKSHSAPPARVATAAPAAHVYGNSPGYVGSQECATCHGEISEKFRRSEMAQSFVRVRSAPAIEEDGEVHDPKTDLHYKIERRDGRLFVVESLRDKAGDMVHELEVEASYVIGSGLQGRSYAADFNGYLTMLPVGWYSEPRRWGLSPGYEVSNLRFDRPVTPECAGCHNAEPTFVAGSGFRFRSPLPDGIGCEQCHGPGAEHVDRQRSAMLHGEPVEDPDTSIVNPARLPADLQQDVCLQCHLLSDIMVLQPDKGPFDFRPGQRLRDFRSDFFTSKQTGERPGSVGHASRSMNSRCFLASDGRMTCAKCHTPHEPLKETPAGYYNERCLDCHVDRGCSRTLDAGQTAREGDCVACHMPRVASANIGHAATTEHWIRRRPEPASAAFATGPRPKRGLPVGFWGDEGDGQIGSALIMGREYIDDRDMLAKGTKLLEQELRRAYSVDWLFRIGLGYFHMERWDLAGSAFDEVLRRNPDNQEARSMLASVLARMGQLPDAAQLFEDVLRRNPEFSGSDSDLAILYFDLERPDRLVATAQGVFRDHPPNPFVLSLVAKAHLLMDDDLNAALSLVDQAKSMNPLIPAPFMIEAQIAVKLNDVVRGERALRGAIRAADSFMPAHLALGELLARTGRRDEAIKCYEHVLELNPANAPAQRALLQLRTQRTTQP